MSKPKRLATADDHSTAPVGIRLTIYSKRATKRGAEHRAAESALPVYTYGERLRFPRSCGCRETMAIPAHSTWWDISHPRAFA